MDSGDSSYFLLRHLEPYEQVLILLCKASVKYTFYAWQSKDAILAYPAFLRPVVGPFLPEIRSLNKFRKIGVELLKPFLDLHLASEQSKMARHEENKDEQGNMVSWILGHTPDSQRSNAAVLGNNQMGCTSNHSFSQVPADCGTVNFAAIHTTAMATTAAIYDLAAYPEYIQPLRDEIQQVIKEDGQDVDGNGIMKLKKPSMPKLWKLDSFLRESMRLTPPLLSKC